MDELLLNGFDQASEALALAEELESFPLGMSSGDMNGDGLRDLVIHMTDGFAVLLAEVAQ